MKNICIFATIIVMAGMSVIAMGGPINEATGILTGVVTGPGGQGLPGVTVTASNDNVTVVVVTGEGGNFRITEMESGVYDVRGDLYGFHSTVAPGVELDGHDVTHVQLALSSSTFHDTMEVNSASPRDSLEASKIRESDARDVGEALATMPGVWKVRRGGIANDVVLRGFQGEDIAVLIDGARVAGACPSGMDPPTFHLDFAEVDRIELGPGSGRIASQGGLGGTINVVTKKPGEGFHADATLVAGSFGMVNPSATVSYGTDKFGVLAGGSHRSSEPFEDGSGQRFTENANYTDAVDNVDAYDVTSAWTRLFYRPGEVHELNLSYAHQEADDVLYPTLMMDAVYDDTDRVVLGYRFTPSAEILSEIRATAYGTQVKHWMVDSLRTTAANAPRGWGMGTNATTQVVGATAEADLGDFTLGLEAYSRNWDAWTEMAGMNYMRQFSVPDVDVDVLGLSLRWKHELSPQTTLEVGGRVDRVTTTADPTKANTNLYFAYHGVRDTSATDTEPSLSVDLGHDFGNRLSLNGRISSSVRSPDARERYFGLKRMGADWVGNPSLAPPRSNGAELGLTWTAGSAVITATTWIDDVTDYITLYSQSRVNMVPGVMNTQAQTYANVNARLTGATIEGTAALSSRLYLSGNLSWVRGTKDPDPALGILSSNLAEMPPLTARLALRWQDQRYFAEIEGLGSAEQDRVDTDLSEETTPAYGIFNIKGGASLGSFRLQLIIHNLLNRTYHENLSYLRNPYRSGVRINEPGRSISLSLGWKM